MTKPTRLPQDFRGQRRVLQDAANRAASAVLADVHDDDGMVSAYQGSRLLFRCSPGRWHAVMNSFPDDDEGG